MKKKIITILCVAAFFATTSCDKEMLETLMDVVDSTQNGGTNDTIAPTPGNDTIPVNPGQDTIAPTPSNDTIPVNPGQDTVLPTPQPQDTTVVYGDPYISTLFSGEAVDYTTYDAYYYFQGDTAVYILKAWMGTTQDGMITLPMLQLGWLLIDGKYHIDFCSYFDDPEKVNHMYELYGSLYSDWGLYTIASGTIDYDFSSNMLRNAEFTFTLFDRYAYWVVDASETPQMAMIDISFSNIDFIYYDPSQRVKSMRKETPTLVGRKSTETKARMKRNATLR